MLQPQLFGFRVDYIGGMSVSGAVFGGMGRH